MIRRTGNEIGLTGNSNGFHMFYGPNDDSGYLEGCCPTKVFYFVTNINIAQEGIHEITDIF